MNIQVYGKTDKGRQRKTNEDCFKIHWENDAGDDQVGVFVIADGVAGNYHGEVASQLFCERAVQMVLGATAFARYTFQRDQELRKELLQLLSTTAMHVGHEIHAQAEAQPRYRGMCTTGIILTIVGQGAFLAHAGDSRGYLHRDGIIYRLTEDHTVLNELLKSGTLSAKDAANSPMANFLSRAWGLSPVVEPDTLFIKLEPGDRIILCTDGLHNYLRGKDILAQSKSHGDNESFVDALIDLANAEGGKDNITVVTIQVAKEDHVIAPGKVSLDKQLGTMVNAFLFQGLNEQELMRVMRVTHLVEVPKGTLIIRDGEKGAVFYLVLRGRASIMKGSDELTRIRDGGHFGELALIDDMERSADVIARTDMILMTINRKDLLGLLNDDKILANKLLMNFLLNLSARVRDLSEKK